MSKYFLIENNKKKAILDDENPYLFEVGKLDIKYNCETPLNPPTYYGEVSRPYYNYIMRLDKVNSWYKIGGVWLARAKYKTAIYGITLTVRKDRLYGIRFKQPTDETNACWARISNSAVGASILNDANIASLSLQIYPANSNLTLPIILDNYIEVIEIGNDIDCMPICKTGVEVYSKNQVPIWNSNCKMIDVVDFYAGNIAGNYNYANGDTTCIVVPNNNYAYCRQPYTNHDLLTYRDYWRLSNEGLINEVINTTSGTDPNAGWDGIWDIREDGASAWVSSFISGIICR